MKRKKPPSQRRLVAASVVRREDLSITNEAEYIIRRAVERQGCLVSVGPLIFFATDTGDAWILDPGDSLALCLADNGQRLPFTIIETATRYGIEWNATYLIRGEAFCVRDRLGRERTIQGYPTKEIATAGRLGAR